MNKEQFERYMTKGRQIEPHIVDLFIRDVEELPPEFHEISYHLIVTLLDFDVPYWLANVTDLIRDVLKKRLP